MPNGEKSGLISCLSSGTSPRGWGKLFQPQRLPPSFRNIPTRVGKTAAAKSEGMALSEHPHAGGENGTIHLLRRRSVGTSPRGWGKLLLATGHTHFIRNIPTRVGKTREEDKRELKTPEHPHAGGENSVPVGNCLQVAGTSPRGWGKLCRTLIRPTAQRNIPTRVGKTDSIRRINAFGTEHPHAGGENAWKRVVWKRSVGTSPRGWGKLCLWGQI